MQKVPPYILNDFICFIALCHAAIMAISVHGIMYTAAQGIARSDWKRTNYKIAAEINIESSTAGKWSGTIYKCFRVPFIVRCNSFRVSAFGYLTRTSQ